MRVLPLILALLLTACGGGVPAPSGLEALLARLEDGDAQALEPALRLLATAPGDTESRERLRAALRGLPLRRAQVEAVVAPADPELARELVAARAVGLAVTGDEVALAQAVAQAAARGDDWIHSAPALDRGAAVVRIRRLPPGDAFELVLHRGREPIKDAILRLECPAPAAASCAEPALTRTVLELLGQ